jgi:hypothetical protein
MFAGKICPALVVMCSHCQGILRLGLTVNCMTRLIVREMERAAFMAFGVLLVHCRKTINQGSTIYSAGIDYLHRIEYQQQANPEELEMHGTLGTRPIVRPDARSPYARYGKKPYRYSAAYYAWRRTFVRKAAEAEAKHAAVEAERKAYGKANQV